MTQAQRDIRRKLNVLEYVRERGNVAKACWYFGISRQCYYNWLHAYEHRGEAGLIDSRPCSENHKLRTPKPVETKIIHLRTTYHFGPQVDRLVPRALPRHQDLSARRLQRAEKKRLGPPAGQHPHTLHAECDPLARSRYRVTTSSST
jgi:transposase